jgi:hypothetical protein
MDQNARSPSSFMSDMYPSKDENKFSFSIPSAKSTSVSHIRKSSSSDAYTKHQQQPQRQEFVIPGFSDFNDLHPSRRPLTSASLSAATASDTSSQQPRRIRLATPRKERKLIPFSLDMTPPVKLEEPSATFTSNRAHISMLTDDFSPSESSSPIRIDQRSMDSSGSGRFVLSDKENMGLGDQTLVSVGSTAGKHDAKAYGDFGSVYYHLLCFIRPVE